MQEIERKFLVNHLLWEKLQKPVPHQIVQSYLSQNPACTIRIRLKDDKGFLTIKGQTIGITRSEFEYPIPADEAQQMIVSFAEKTLSKLRFEIQHGTHLWEVDVFSGKLEGLIVAEIELQYEEEVFELPEWIAEEVSDDPSYYNSNLIDRC